jgi:competence/damage-inducible protein CinA C-terminal domain
VNEVKASIITIGDELLIGQTIDTNSAFIAQELNKIGIWVRRRLAIGDVEADILKSLKEETISSKIIIITGGLGPTGDDITKQVLAKYFNSGWTINEEALKNVVDIFNKLNRPLIERNLKQAEVPDNCTVLQNKRGTAPGMWFEKDEVIVISLPGVPNEMKGLMIDSVIPRLKKLRLPYVIHRTLLLAGKGESEVAELIKSYETSLPEHIKLAYLPAYGLLRLRLTGKSENGEFLEREINTLFQQLVQMVQPWIIAEDDITVPMALIRILNKHGKTIGTAESCTGGFIAQQITAIAGASNVYNGSIVSYSNSVKEDLLGVKEETLRSFGAVSEETVTEMLLGLISKLNTDYGIATSGIMGPGGGSDQKPVGTVWIAVGNRESIMTNKYQLRFNRERNIEQTAYLGMVSVFKFIKEVEGQ